MKHGEIVFEVTEAVKSGYDARALGYSIFTQGEDWTDLKEMVQDAVLCHFDNVNVPNAVKVNLIEDKDITVCACSFRI